jgi:hypothetical protein
LAADRTRWDVAEGSPGTPGSPTEGTIVAAPNPIEIQKYLSGIDYPASKDDVVSTAEKENAPDDVLEALRAIPDREYDGPTAVSSAVSDAN